jgi:hypothetical protein
MKDRGRGLNGNVVAGRLEASHSGTMSGMIIGSPPVTTTWRAPNA